MLQGDEVLDGAEIIAEVEVAGRLNARKDAGSEIGHLWRVPEGGLALWANRGGHSGAWGPAQARVWPLSGAPEELAEIGRAGELAEERKDGHAAGNQPEHDGGTHEQPTGQWPG